MKEKHSLQQPTLQWPTDNKVFWKTVKPFFTEKVKTSNNIILTLINKGRRGNM